MSATNMIGSLQRTDKMRNVAATIVKMLQFTAVIMGGMLPLPAAKAQDAACSAKPGDEAAIVGTLRGMYAAATVDDRAEMRSYFAPGFYMFDGGNRYDGDSVMDLIEDSYKKGVRYVWSVTKPDVHVYCNEAWIAYENEGSITKPGAGTTPVHWLESAVLERQGGTWKMTFFQSTRVPPPAPIPEPRPAPAN
jgi:hypothetical protein